MKTVKVYDNTEIPIRYESKCQPSNVHLELKNIKTGKNILIPSQINEDNDRLKFGLSSVMDALIQDDIKVYKPTLYFMFENKNPEVKKLDDIEFQICSTPHLNTSQNREESSLNENNEMLITNVEIDESVEKNNEAVKLEENDGVSFDELSVESLLYS